MPNKGTPIDKVLNVLEHSVKAADNLPGVDVHVDNPAVRHEEFYGTDGVTDIFVFDAGVPMDNNTSLHNFTPGEDYFLFQNMEGRDLTVGEQQFGGSGQPIAFNFVLFHSTPESQGTNMKGANIVVWDQDAPYQHDTIQSAVLPFDGHLVFV
jgi:hypothetical protein